MSEFFVMESVSTTSIKIKIILEMEVFFYSSTSSEGNFVCHAQKIDALQAAHKIINAYIGREKSNVIITAIF